jgi:hypothetical protein
MSIFKGKEIPKKQLLSVLAYKYSNILLAILLHTAYKEYIPD